MVIRNEKKIWRWQMNKWSLKNAYLIRETSIPPILPPHRYSQFSNAHNLTSYYSFNTFNYSLRGLSLCPDSHATFPVVFPLLQQLLHKLAFRPLCSKQRLKTIILRTPWEALFSPQSTPCPWEVSFTSPNIYIVWYMLFSFF